MLRIITSTLTILGSLLLSGCASTTADVTNTSPKVFKSSLKPEDSVKCIIKNIDSNYGNMDPRIEESSRPDVTTIRVRRHDVGIAALIDVEPTDSGSNITVRISNHFPLKGTLANIFSKNCV